MTKRKAKKVFTREFCGPGCWWIDTKNLEFNSECPCGCGRPLRILLCKDVKIESCWLWDGNLEIPTLTPSIKRMDGCKWHGFLTQGLWNYCADGAPNSPDCVSPGKLV